VVAVQRAVRPRLDGARILVVDDEADSRELLLQLLASWGARAVGAGSATEALAAIASDRPEILVSDIAMPGADGCALVGEVRRAEQALGLLPVPAIALTAFTRPDDRRRMLAAGFDTHLAKPVDADELLSTLTALLRRAERGPGADGADGRRRAAGPPPLAGAPAGATLERKAGADGTQARGAGLRAR
jgi:CheY-like chemotaxis protein